MCKLKATTRLVKDILTKDERARNSDSFLYFLVLEEYSRQTGDAIISMTVREFLLTMNKLGVPGFETVRRARQKIQAAYPELAACDKVEAMRIVNEEKFKAYAQAVSNV